MKIILMTIKLVSRDKSHQFHSLSAGGYFWAVWLGVPQDTSYVMITDDPCFKTSTKRGTRLRFGIEKHFI